jgi:hypothetical protein
VRGYSFCACCVLENLFLQVYISARECVHVRVFGECSAPDLRLAFSHLACVCVCACTCVYYVCMHVCVCVHFFECVCMHMCECVI